MPVLREKSNIPFVYIYMYIYKKKLYSFVWLSIFVETFAIAYYPVDRIEWKSRETKEQSKKKDIDNDTVSKRTVNI